MSQERTHVWITQCHLMAVAVIQVTATPPANPASSAAFSLVVLMQCSSLQHLSWACLHRAQFSMAGTNLQVVALAPANPEATAALAAQQAAEEKEYQRLKAELQTWCQGTALTCFVATVIFYSKVTSWLSISVVEIMP